MKILISLILVFGLAEITLSQSKPVSVDSSMVPRFHSIYGDTVLSREDSGVLAAIIRLKQLHAMFKQEVDNPRATLDDFMTWIDLRLVRGHSPAFVKKHLSER